MKIQFVFIRSVIVAFALSVSLSLSLMAAENGCPDHAHPASSSGRIVYCECDDPFILYGEKCQYKAAVEDQLQQKILKALQGIKSITAAISAEHYALLIPRVRTHLEQIGILAGTAVLERHPRALVAEALSLSIDLSKALEEWNSCSATPDLQVDCDNLRIFQKILNDTANELIKVQQQ